MQHIKNLSSKCGFMNLFKSSLQRTADGGGKPFTPGAWFFASFTTKVWGRWKNIREEEPALCAVS